MHIAALDELGGLDVLGSPKTDNQYHAGWAWAGSTPYKGTKLLASHFGGTRNPMAVRWPARSSPTRRRARSSTTATTSSRPSTRSLGITPPRVVNGVPQDPIDGVSFAYTFDDAKRQGPDAHPVLRDHGQPRDLPRRLDRLRLRPARSVGARACRPGIREWTPDNDKWELYNLDEDWSQANDLAAEMPEKLAQMKETVRRSRRPGTSVLPDRRRPLGPVLAPRAAHRRRRTREWTFAGDITRMPEFCAPALGNRPNIVTIDVEIPANANGVLYALGGVSGGLTCYVKDGDALLRVQPLHHPAHEDPRQASSCPPAR